MTVPYRIAARAMLLAIFVAAAASAQSDEEGASGSWFDSLSNWLGDVGGYLGEKTDQVFAPSLPRLGDVQGGLLQGLVQRSRSFRESYPVPTGCLVSVSNRFGEIRFQTWDNPRVQVRAEITAGAESGDVALHLADTTSVEVLVNENEKSITIRTAEPDTRELGKVAIEVNYVITVPRDASAVTQNDFGDTIIHGLGGAVTVKSRYGAVDLRNIGGPVDAQAWGGGEFTLLAHGLRQGGRFDLRRTESEFADVAGGLRIENYWGNVTVRGIAAESDLDIRSDNGPVHLLLDEGSAPDIGALVTFGTIRSDIPLLQSSPGENLVTARSANIESRQRVTANVKFADLHISQEGASPASPAQPVSEDGPHVTEPAREELDVPDNIEIVVDATIGDIVIEGIDEARLYVEAEKLVVLNSNATAQAALEALPFKVERLDGQVRIRTSADTSITSLGCTRYRTDLTIRCPRTASLRVTAANGHTAVTGTGGNVTVTQKAGRISAEHTKGPLALTNEKGSIYVADCSGPADLSLNGGIAETRGIYGKQTVYCVSGKAVIDEPGGDVTVRSHSGDARIMALQGVAGDYDVKVEDGNLSILLSQSSNDAKLSVTARNGTVNSAIRLFNGQMENGVVTYSGGVADGAHTVKLEANNGNIVID